MHSVKPSKLGIVVGAFLGLWHALWSVLVAAGLAQPTLDWIFRLHMLESPFRVAEFNLGTAIMLVVATTVVGYAAGWVAAVIWNRVHRA